MMVDSITAPDSSKYQRKAEAYDLGMLRSQQLRASEWHQ